MAMTASVKDELSRLSITKPCCRKAEVSSLLRFAGGLHIAAGKIVIEVELDTSQSARRLRKDIADIYGHDSDLAVLSSSGLRKGSRYVVRVINEGDALARQTGLVDANGRPVRVGNYLMQWYYSLLRGMNYQTIMYYYLLRVMIDL